MKTKRSLYIYTGIFLLVIAYGVTTHIDEPSNDREWNDRFTRPVSAMTGDNIVRIANVRDWHYQTGEVTHQIWRDELLVNVNDITKMWFVLEPFPSWQQAGHSFLTFEFNDGTALSFSIEARTEKDERYGVLPGLLDRFELMYVWSTERDAIARRLLFLEHDVKMYPLEIEPEFAQEIFLTLLDETNKLESNPRFYNTFTANCTNLLAKIINERFPESVSYDISWNLPGTSDSFLMQEGYIKVEDTVEATKRMWDLSPHRERLSATSYRQFSSELRRAIPSTEN